MDSPPSYQTPLRTVQIIRVITGRGKHSHNGKAKIKLAIIRLIMDNSLSVYQDVTAKGKVNPGSFIIKIR